MYHTPHFRPHFIFDTTPHISDHTDHTSYLIPPFISDFIPNFISHFTFHTTVHTTGDHHRPHYKTQHMTHLYWSSPEPGVGGGPRPLSAVSEI